MTLKFNGRRPSATVLVALVIAAACTAGADKAVGPSPIILDEPNYAAAPAAAAAVPLGPGVVISQVYGGGGNAGATIRHDFIELYNGTSSDVSLAGASVQYGSSAGTGAWLVTPLTGTILSGHYYLVREASGASTTVPPVSAPDDSGSIAMSATAGKVALVRNTTPLSGACPVSVVVIDVVGFGSANCSEVAPTATLSNTTAALRKDGGRQDNNNNSTDFSTGAPNARNSRSDPLPPLNALQVTISPLTPAALEGASLTFTASATKGGQPVVITSAKWSSSNTAVATIDEASGAASTLTKGTTTIGVAVTTAEGSTSSSTTLTVSGAPATVVVSPLTWSLKTGQSKTFTAVAKDADGNTVATSFTWTSSNAVVTVDATTGAAIARTVGSAQVIATTPNGKSGSATVTVTAGNVSVSTRTDILPVGFQTQLFLNSGGSDSNGNPVGSDGITWSSSNADVVSVDPATGVITANAAGSAVISATAKSDGISSGGTTITTAVLPVSPTARVGHNTELGLPTDADPSDDVVIARRQYTLSYNASRGSPNWVSWNLDASHKTSTGSSPRCNCFTADTALVRFGIRPYDTNDWINGGAYSRGHMSPSADWASSPGDNASTFFLSNMIPQNQTANAGAWGDLENYLRTLAVGNTEIYIISGPIFTKDRSGAGVDGLGYMARTNGSTARIAIPDSMWKVAIVVSDTRSASEIDSPSDVQVIAVNMANESKSTGSWTLYQTTINKIERSTGYDLLSTLPKDLQCRIEVRNCVPVAHITGNVSGGDEGETLTFSATTSSDADAGDVLSYRWDVAGQPAGAAATLSYTFADNGNFGVRLIVADPDGAADTVTTTVAVANVAPRVASFGGATILQGETYTAAGNFTDPGADSWSGSVNYGDGSGTSALAIAGKSFDLEHRYTAAGAFTVGVSVSDDDAGSGTASATVNVQSPLEGIANLSDALSSLTATGPGPVKGPNKEGLNKGQLNSLQVKLDNATRQLEDGNTNAATGMLGAFLNELDAMVQSGKVSSTAAQPIIDYARRVIASIEG